MLIKSNCQLQTIFSRFSFVLEKDFFHNFLLQLLLFFEEECEASKIPCGIDIISTTFHYFLLLDGGRDKLNKTFYKKCLKLRDASRKNFRNCLSKNRLNWRIYSGNKRISIGDIWYVLNFSIQYNTQVYHWKRKQ